jgi:hypothetical protein
MLCEDCVSIISLSQRVKELQDIRNTVRELSATMAKQKVSQADTQKGELSIAETESVGLEEYTLYIWLTEYL